MASIGHFPAYIDLGLKIGARFFSIAEETWSTMSVEDRWAANHQFLDRAVRDGCVFRLATPPDRIRRNSYFEREIAYLGQLGFTLIEGPSGWEMRR